MSKEVKVTYSTGELIQFFIDVKTEYPNTSLDSTIACNVYQQFRQHRMHHTEWAKHPNQLTNKDALDYIWKNHWTNKPT